MKRLDANRSIKEWLLLLAILAIGGWLAVKYYWPTLSAMNYSDFLGP